MNNEEGITAPNVNMGTKSNIDLGITMNTGRVFNDDTSITREEKMILREQGRNPDKKDGLDNSAAGVANFRIMSNHF